VFTSDLASRLDLVVAGPTVFASERRDDDFTKIWYGSEEQTGRPLLDWSSVSLQEHRVFGIDLTCS
jgi:hypothetical protein